MFVLFFTAVTQQGFAGYVGDKTTESQVTFISRVQFSSIKTPGPLATQKQIKRQLQFVFSQFRESIDGAEYPDSKISEVKTQNLRPGLYETTYRYIGTFIIADKVSALDLILPLNPSLTIASVNLKQCSYHPTEIDGSLAWYYWNPLTDNCPENRENVDYVKVPVEFIRLPPTQKTFPEYSRLLDQAQTFNVSAFCGKNDLNGTVDLNVSNDVAVYDCKNLIRELSSSGFILHKKWSLEDVKSVVPGVVNSIPTILDFEYQGTLAKIRVRVFFGQTRFVTGPKAFHYFLKKALEEDAVIMYSGHSGVGKNLNLQMIEFAQGFKIQIPKDRYQIIQIQGCFSYSYYVKDFLQRKATPQDIKGTHNLDIMSNGVEGYFGDNFRGQKILIEALRQYASREKLVSWQEIIARYQALQDAGFEVPLFNIVGDEDNPTNLSF